MNFPSPSQFQTIIYATDDKQNVGDLSEMKLSERQRKILGFVKESPTITGKKNVGDLVSEPTYH